MKTQNTIYLDHQATTPVDPRVLKEMIPYFRDSFGNPHSSDHCLGWESARAVENAAARVARLIGADSDEIIFTSGATESNNAALLGLGRRASGNRRRILLSAVEHKCILTVGRVLHEQYGFKVDLIPVDRDGFIDLPALENALRDDVLAVSVMAVNNEIGTIQRIEDISNLARSYGALFHCDAAQAPVAMNMDSMATYSDILSLSSHKMYGPKGVGVVRVSRELLTKIEPLIYGGGQQNALRSGTVPTPLCIGMAAAADLLAGDAAEEQRTDLRRRRDAFIERLRGLAWPVAVNGPEGRARHPGNANIRFPGFCAHDILSALQPRLAASTGSACTSGIPEPSHVLRAIGLDGAEAESSIRFSLGFGTCDADVEEAVGLIEETLARLSRVDAAVGSSAPAPDPSV